MSTVGNPFLKSLTRPQGVGSLAPKKLPTSPSQKRLVEENSNNSYDVVLPVFSSSLFSPGPVTPPTGSLFSNSGSAEAQQVNALAGSFTQIDSNSDGIVSEDEMKSSPLANQFKTVIDKNSRLMFSNIDPDDKAWLGLSLQDLQNISKQLGNGQTLDQIAAENEANYMANNPTVTNFDEHVQNQRLKAQP